MSKWLHDLQIAFRAQRGAPVTTLAAIFVIALGTGINVAVFAVIHGVLLQPLPYPDAERLMILSMAVADGADFAVPGAEVDEWRERLRTVEAVAGYATAERTVRGGAEPLKVTTAFVTETFFDVLRTAPRRGQLETFREESGVTVLSATLAERLARTDPDGLVANLVIGGRAFEVGAVMPADFAFPGERVGAWVQIVPGQEMVGGRDLAPPERFHLIARVRPGVTAEQIRDDMARVFFELRGEQAGLDIGGPTVTPLGDAVIGDLRPVLAAALAAALLVLLVTCGNVAMLLLGRAVERRRESAVRLALGARGLDVARGSLAESLMLAAAGSMLGLGLAVSLLELLARFGTELLPRVRTISIDGPVLVASLVMIALVAVVCGLAPALRMAREDFSAALRGGRSGSAGGSRRALSALVVAQIVVAVVLLAGAALLGQTVLRLLSAEGSIDPGGVLSVELARGHADGGGSEEARRSVAFAREVLGRVRALPGVEAAGIGSHLPPHVLPFQFFVRFRTENREDSLRMSAVSVTPGFLEALGVRAAAGSFLRDADASTVLLSRTAARFYCPDRDLVGRDLPIRLPPFVSFPHPPKINGVVPDIRYAGLDQPANAAVYVPWAARPTGTSYLAVKTSGSPRVLMPALRRILRQADPAMPVPPIRTLGDEMARSIDDRRLRVASALGFAGVALGVALGGILALFARAVAERRREMAIRLALGASGRRVTGMMLRRAALLTSLGAVLGLAATLVLGRGLGNLLYGIAPHDPVTLLGVVALVGSAGLLAAWIPARRAAWIEPGELLRQE